MAYNRLGTATGTYPCKLTIDKCLYDWCQSRDIIINRLVNYALKEYLHRLQTDQLSITPLIVQGRRKERYMHDENKVVATRIRRDLVEYCRMNTLNLNATIRAAIADEMCKIEDYKRKNGDYPLYTIEYTRHSLPPRATDGDERKNCAHQHDKRNNSDIQTKIVHYLDDPCKYADWKDGHTPDCCGHCTYYGENYETCYQAKCTRHD